MAVIRKADGKSQWIDRAAYETWKRILGWGRRDGQNKGGEGVIYGDPKKKKKKKKGGLAKRTLPQRTLHACASMRISFTAESLSSFSSLSIAALVLPCLARFSAKLLRICSLSMPPSTTVASCDPSCCGASSSFPLYFWLCASDLAVRAMYGLQM
jgi:hypothetical protein